MHTDPPILLDVESVSRCDLTVHGGRLYWEHPSTRALCVVMHDPRTGARDLWLPGDPAPACLEGRDLAAHNWTGFDRFATVRLGWRPLSYASGIDTSEAARLAGLPGSLDGLGKRWLGLEKDKASSEFVVRLSSCRRPAGVKRRGVWSSDRISPEEWRTFTATEKRERGVQPTITYDDVARTAYYCNSDVDIMAHGWPALEPFLDYEPEVRVVDRLVNDRGVAFDVQLARRLLEEDERNAAMVVDEVARELGLPAHVVREVAQSPEQFAEVTGLPNAQKATLDEYEGEWMPLIRARRALASIARGKLEAGLARVSADGRLRDSHRYVGAHTWRWSGRGMQLQNIPRPEKRFEDWGDAEICAAAEAVLGGAHVDAATIDVLLRATVHARDGNELAVCDYSGVESRGTAWCAGDQGALDVFAAGLDPYKAAAVDVYGVPYEAITKPQRQVGKVAVLALGYQGGHRAFEKMARQNGVSLEGVDAPAVVAAWRRAHQPTVRFWYDLERAFVRAANGSAARCSVFECVPSDDGRDVAIFLPSGRPIVYPEVRLRRDERGRPKVSFAPAKGGAGTYVNEAGELRADLYGGKLTENVIQALCRDLMADALVSAERAGLAPVLHVHDEIVAEVPRGAEGLDVLQRIMLHLPEWAQGFPIGAAGHYGRRYRK